MRRRPQYSFVRDEGAAPLAACALGPAGERAGDRAAAAEAYSRFLRRWGRADPSAQPRVIEVREVLKQLTGEQQNP